jgi:hypothetical protein
MLISSKFEINDKYDKGAHQDPDRPNLKDF